MWLQLVKYMDRLYKLLTQSRFLVVNYFLFIMVMKELMLMEGGEATMGDSDGVSLPIFLVSRSIFVYFMFLRHPFMILHKGSYL
jgi:hypothetical protein